MAEALRDALGDRRQDNPRVAVPHKHHVSQVIVLDQVDHIHDVGFQRNPVGKEMGRSASPVRLMGKTVCPALRSLSATGFQHHAPHHDPGTRTKAGFRPKSVSVVSIADLPVKVRFAFEKMYQERSSGQLGFP